MKIKDNIDKKVISELLETLSDDTKIYIGGDSFRTRIKGIWFATYSVVVVVHKNGNNGCQIFGKTVRERDYDSKKHKPTTRLMNEVIKVSEVYMEIADILSGHEVEIHLDLNPKKDTGSNHVVSQAIGYIKGTTGLDAVIKPEALAASFGAHSFPSFNVSSKSAKEAFKEKAYFLAKNKR